MKKTFFIIASLFLYVTMQAQPPRPEWVKNSNLLPKSYIYGEGIGKDRSAAIASARKDAFDKIISSAIGIEFTQITYADYLSKNYNVQVQIANQALSQRQVHETDDICVPDGVKVYVVFEINGAGNNFSFYDADFERELKKWNGECEGVYPFSPRVFVPGLRQFDKGSTTKAWLIIGGEAALLGGAGIAEYLRRDANNMFSTTHDKEYYRDKARLYGNWRNGLLIGAAALYVYNVIDGIGAKGTKKGNKRLTIVPYTNMESAGLALTFKF